MRDEEYSLDLPLPMEHIFPMSKIRFKPHTHFEDHYGLGRTAGIDEAGCGPWAGPVVAAAVIMRPSLLSYAFISEMTDSKQLSPKKRASLVTHLKEVATLSPAPLLWSVGTATSQEIDTLNIRQANFLAMTRALLGLEEAPLTILVDGTPGLQADVPVIPIVRGDQQCLSIAMASLFAKVTRDDLMDQLHEEYPVYDWAQNKGYGTARHQEALATHGPTPHHRMSYKPLHRYHP